jgi:tetratricopeptide (TPR) repeat protein
MAYAAVERFDDAIFQFREALLISCSDPYLEALLGYAKARSGMIDDAFQILGSLCHRSSNQYTPAFAIALVYIGLGDQKRAFEWLNTARQNRSTHVIFAKDDSLLDPIRSDPRFGALLHQIGLS